MTRPTDDAFLSSRWGRLARRWAPAIGVTALAAALRLLFLGHVPPGLYHDEAFNGLDALRVLGGDHSVYFPTNRGREPLFIYLVAASVGLLGRTPGAVRMAAAICGTLTVPASYMMTRTWFNRRVALLSAAILATTYWHVQLSRIGFRAVMLPLGIALTLWASGKALQSGRRRTWVLAGLAYGACFYTYLAARFTLVVLVAFIAYLLATGQKDRLWPGVAYFVAGACVILLPLGVYTLGHWEAVLGRPGEVSVFNPLINEGDLPGTLVRQLMSTLAMFLVRGDTIARHNLPGRPVFNPLMGGAMVLGTALAIARARRKEAGAVLILLWVGLMLVPTWLAEDAPHFLRAVGILPLLFVLPALGLDRAMRWVEKRGGRLGSLALVCGVLASNLGKTSWDYFVRYPARADTGYAFEDAASRLAARVNTFRGAGWEGDGIAARWTAPEVDREVYVDRRVWDEWISIEFLVPATEGVRIFAPDSPPSPAGPAMVVIWPHDGVEPYASALPIDSRITPQPGPLTRGDLEETAYSAYFTYVVTPAQTLTVAPIAQFDDGIGLIDYAVEPDDGTWEVELEWLATSAPGDDYTVSIQLMSQGQVVAQEDGEPGGGAYPTGVWKAGQLVVDEHELNVPEQEPVDAHILVGLYAWPSMEQLEVRDQNGVPLGARVSLPIGEPAPP